MQEKWFADCETKEAREQREKELSSYRKAFSVLKEVLKTQYEERPPSDYDCPSWSHKQADVNGANRKLEQIIRLISID